MIEGTYEKEGPRNRESTHIVFTVLNILIDSIIVIIEINEF